MDDDTDLDWQQPNSIRSLLGAAKDIIFWLNYGGMLKLIELGEENIKDKNGCTALHWACSNIGNKHIEILEELLERGVDVNAKNKNGSTPLHGACEHSNIKVIKTLLKYELNINEVNNKGETPLYNACRFGHMEVMELLLDYGADSEVVMDLIYYREKNEHLQCARISEGKIKKAMKLFDDHSRKSNVKPALN
jgi:ankyrin repeat protein